MLRSYENQWVALVDTGEREFVDGAGLSPIQALEDAKAKGFEEVVLFSVPSFSRIFIPLGPTTTFSTPN